MNFVEIKVSCNPEFSDILIAEFSEVGFNSFMENQEGFDAYIEENQYNEENLIELKDKYASYIEFSYELNKIEKVNWNEEWEKNYDPIIVSDQCIVKASFHQIEKSYPFEILINPKMSFGTGHHATTFLMLNQQLNIDFKEKRVLDAGCGTGILGIMASMAGAEKVISCDIDEWSVENSIENIDLNNCNNVQVYKGTIEVVPKEKPFDVLLANINKNVLLDEIPVYSNLQAPGGRLLLSGFYEDDIEDIELKCIAHKYEKIKYLTKDSWACTLFKKQ